MHVSMYLISCACMHASICFCVHVYVYSYVPICTYTCTCFALNCMCVYMMHGLSERRQVIKNESLKEFDAIKERHEAAWHLVAKGMKQLGT